MDLPNINNITALGGIGIAAGLAAFAAGWRQVLGFARYVSGFLILQKEVRYALSDPVIIYLRRHYKKLPSGISVYRSQIAQAAIAIDKWKLPIFTRHLKQSGYLYDQMPGLTPDTYLLTVDTPNVAALAQVIKAANTEATETGAQK